MAKKIQFLTNVGRAKYPHLNKPDTAFNTDNPKYKTELVMSQEDAKPLVAKIKEAAAEEFGAKKNIRLPYSVDEETGEVSFKVQSKYQPKFYDTKGQVIAPSALPNIGGGSQLRGGGILNLYTVTGTSGVGLMLDKIQVVEVVGFGGDETGFDEIEGSFVVDASMGATSDNLKTDVTKDDFDF